MAHHTSSGHGPHWRAVFVEIPGSHFLPTFLSLHRLFLTPPWEPEDVQWGNLSSRRQPWIITTINQLGNKETERTVSLNWKTVQDCLLGAFSQLFIEHVWEKKKEKIFLVYHSKNGRRVICFIIWPLRQTFGSFRNAVKQNALSLRMKCTLHQNNLSSTAANIILTWLLLVIHTVNKYCHNHWAWVPSDSVGRKAVCVEPIQDTLLSVPVSSRRTSLKSNQRSAQSASAHYYSSAHTKQGPLTRVSNNTSSSSLRGEGFGLRGIVCRAVRPLTHTESMLTGRSCVWRHHFHCLKQSCEQEVSCMQVLKP